MKFELAEIVTKDKLVHQGIFYYPAKPDKKAILWVHGLTSKFYGDPALMNLFADLCDKHDMGFASFNNRGHDVIASIRKVDPLERGGYGRVTMGAATEVFEECVFDIDAGISFLMKLGFTKVFLVGHSTGANKVCFYAATKKDPRVAGVVLAGPISDRLSLHTDQVNYEKNLLAAKAHIARGQGDQIEQGRHFMPITPKRLWSLLAPNTKEDVFNYGDKQNTLSVFSKITKPLLVIFSGNDEAADRPVSTIKHVFDTHTQSAHYVSRIIPGATHSYEGKEKEFVTIVVKWAASL